MQTCKNCGRVFEGNFCPECGTKREEPVCPHCGAPVRSGAKFCSECGSVLPTSDMGAPSSAMEPSEQACPRPAQVSSAGAPPKQQTVDPAAPPPVSAPPVPSAVAPLPAVPAPSATVQPPRLLYRITAFAPAALCGLYAVLLLLFGLAPVAMVQNLFGTGKYGIGNLYDLQNGATYGVIAAAAFGLVLCVAGVYATAKSGSRGAVMALGCLLHAVWVGGIIVAVVICAEVAKTDDGTGLLSVGAGPILIIVFGALFGLLALCLQFGRRTLAKRYPALAEEEQKRRDAREHAATEDKPTMLGRARLITRLYYFGIPILVGPLILFCFQFFISILVSVLSEFEDNRGIELLLNWFTIASNFSDVLFYGSFIFGIWILTSKKFFLRKLRKYEQSPRLFFEKNYRFQEKSAAPFVLCACILIFSPILKVVQSMISGGYSPFGRMGLQLRGTSAFLSASILLIIQLVLLSALVALLILTISNTRYCKRFPEIAERFPEYEQAPAQFAEDIVRAPLPAVARRTRKGWLISAVSVLLVGAIVVGVMAGTNPFSPHRLDKIEIGAASSRVADVLGTANDDSSGDWLYYSDNAAKLIKKERQLETELAAAIARGDMARIEKLNEQSEALAAKAEKLTYRVIRVRFDGMDTVARVEMALMKGADYSSDPDMREATKVKLSPASVPYTSLAAGTVSITYAAEFENGDYVRALLGEVAVFADSNYRQPTSIDGAGTYYLAWNDGLGLCRTSLQVT